MQVELLKERARKWKFTYLEKKSSEEKEKLKLTGSLLLFIPFLCVGIWTSSCLFMLLLLTWLLIRCLLYGVKKSKEQVKKLIKHNVEAFCVTMQTHENICFTMRRSSAQCCYLYFACGIWIYSRLWWFEKTFHFWVFRFRTFFPIFGKITVCLKCLFHFSKPAFSSAKLMLLLWILCASIL